ncbi:DUF2116 family Zn-ribbon domain-containing protein [Pasteurellaceae bacterium 20609_3]|uniref:DUF2116 family Zn-ribbon domain-containing protein n=1 Tax=Spirabiliibacterium mucosae TaxID=28156 RepID=UPI001AAE14B0|nr:DUF2116 family Zn-ribbon domain-containing protein [Spirabiliibacterium mucosae]MBE2897815.1 DUF2116 family Zn-ribbon domain-containing protein [Spirabiliibacterium mucosae]
MADEADIADRQTQHALAVSLINARRHKHSHLKPTGFCHYCKEKLDSERLFCDEDCRDDYEWEQNLSKQKIL